MVLSLHTLKPIMCAGGGAGVRGMGMAMGAQWRTMDGGGGVTQRGRANLWGTRAEPQRQSRRVLRSALSLSRKWTISVDRKKSNSIELYPITRTGALAASRPTTVGTTVRAETDCAQRPYSSSPSTSASSCFDAAILATTASSRRRAASSSAEPATHQSRRSRVESISSQR